MDTFAYQTADFEISLRAHHDPVFLVFDAEHIERLTCRNAKPTSLADGIAVVGSATPDLFAVRRDQSARLGGRRY